MVSKSQDDRSVGSTVTDLWNSARDNRPRISPWLGCLPSQYSFGMNLSFVRLSILVAVLAGTASADPTRVTCVGDSITVGIGTQNHALESYPAQLGRMLESGFAVKAFAVSGRTLLNSGDYPYQKEKAFKDALASNPNIVTIALGTNDTKPQNWAHQDQFVADYKNLIEKFKALPSHPHIYICYPPFVAGNGKYGITEQNVLLEMPMIDSVAKDEGVEIIDLQSPLKDQPALLPDTVHPNPIGATLLAKAIYKALKGIDFTGDVPPAK